MNRSGPTHEIDYDMIREKVHTKADDLFYGTAITILDYFASIGGFEAILQLLQKGCMRPPVDKSDSKKSEDYNLLSLDFIGDLLHAFYNCKGLMDPEFSNQFVSQVDLIVKDRILNMRDKEIKVLDKQSFENILLSLRFILALAKDEDEVQQTIEKIQIDMATKFLKSTYLEKKLFGLQDFRSLIDRVEARKMLDD